MSKMFATLQLLGLLWGQLTSSGFLFEKSPEGMSRSVQSLPFLSLLIAEFPGCANQQGHHSPAGAFCSMCPPSLPGPCSRGSSHLTCPLLSAWPQFCPSCKSQPHLWDYLALTGHHYCPWASNALTHPLSYLGNDLQIYYAHVCWKYIFKFCL